MDLVEKYQSVFVLAAVVGGFVLGQVSGVPAVADRLILPFLMVI